MLSTFGSDCVALLDAQWSLTVVFLYMIGLRDTLQ